MTKRDAQFLTWGGDAEDERIGDVDDRSLAAGAALEGDVVFGNPIDGAYAYSGFVLKLKGDTAPVCESEGGSRLDANHNRKVSLERRYPLEKSFTGVDIKSFLGR
jgi:hypothetical protein